MSSVPGPKVGTESVKDSYTRTWLLLHIRCERTVHYSLTMSIGEGPDDTSPLLYLECFTSLDTDRVSLVDFYRSSYVQ